VGAKIGNQYWKLRKEHKGPEKRQFCNRGHDTFLIGRDKVRQCLKCRIENGLIQKYGITQLDYDRMYQIQSGCCNICKVHQSLLKKSLAVDHCHKTNKIRGLLCEDCNLALGRFKDSFTNLKNAMQHLRGKNNAPQTR
jgi:Recombination endonuclease VII